MHNDVGTVNKDIASEIVVQADDSSPNSSLEHSGASKQITNDTQLGQDDCIITDTGTSSVPKKVSGTCQGF